MNSTKELQLRPASICNPWHNNASNNGRYEIHAMIIQNSIAADVNDIFARLFNNSSRLVLTLINKSTKLEKKRSQI